MESSQTFLFTVLTHSLAYYSTIQDSEEMELTYRHTHQQMNTQLWCAYKGSVILFIAKQIKLEDGMLSENKSDRGK